MAELKLTPQQRRFFLAVLEGKEPYDAMMAVHTANGEKKALSTKRSTIQQQASRMMKHPAVAGALAQARAAIQARVELGVQDMVDRLEECRRLAMTVDPPQMSAAVAAVLGQAKVLGLVIDRAELNVTHDKPSLFPTKTLELSEEEWKRQFDPTLTLPAPAKKRHTRNDR